MVLPEFPTEGVAPQPSVGANLTIKNPAAYGGSWADEVEDTYGKFSPVHNCRMFFNAQLIVCTASGMHRHLFRIPDAEIF